MHAGSHRCGLKRSGFVVVVMSLGRDGSVMAYDAETASPKATSTDDAMIMKKIPTTKNLDPALNLFGMITPIFPTPP